MTDDVIKTKYVTTDIMNKYNMLDKQTGKTCREFNMLINSTNPIKFYGLASLSMKKSKVLAEKRNDAELTEFIGAGYVMVDLWDKYKHYYMWGFEKDVIAYELALRLKRKYEGEKK